MFFLGLPCELFFGMEYFGVCNQLFSDYYVDVSVVTRL